MASPTDSQEQPTRKEAEPGRTTPTDQSPYPGGAPPHGGNYPHSMGYPSPMGYPPPQQPGYPPPGYHYHGYANAGYHNYPYSQAPPAAYYNNQMYQAPYQEGYNATGFARGVMLGLFLLMFFLFIFSIILWLVLRPQLPVFHLDSFKVSDFNATWPSFQVNWESNVTVINRNTKLRAHFDQIHDFIFYEDEYQLAASFSPSTYLDTEKSYVNNIKLSANSTDISLLGKWVIDKMAEERRHGNVSFSLRMAHWTTFKYSTWYTRKVLLRVFCENINVVFVGASGNGNATPDDLGNCLVLS